MYTSKVIARKVVANNTIELEVSKPVGYEYIAGQYTDLTIIKPKFKDNMGETRSLSFLNRPEDKTIKFLFKTGLSAFKLNLSSISIGEELELSRTKGKFVCADVRKGVFIAGGVGVAPILSILRSQNKSPIAGLFSFSSIDSVPYLGELQKYGKIFITKEESKFINRRINTADIAPFLNHNFYICGSSRFINAILLMLSELKAKESQIFTEDFIGY